MMTAPPHVRGHHQGAAGLWCWAGEWCQHLSWPGLSLLALLRPAHTCYCLHLGLRPWLFSVQASCAQDRKG